MENPYDETSKEIVIRFTSIQVTPETMATVSLVLAVLVILAAGFLILERRWNRKGRC